MDGDPNGIRAKLAANNKNRQLDSLVLLCLLYTSDAADES